MLALFVASLALAGSPDVDLSRGEALVESGAFDEALDVLFAVIDDCAARDDEVARAYLAIGQAEAGLKRDDDARRSFATALALFRDLQLPPRASEGSRALFDEVVAEGGKPWPAGRAIFESVPSLPVEVDGRRYASPAEVSPPFESVVFLTTPPLRVDVGCRRLGTTRVTAYLAESMQVEDNAQTALVATGATLMGMGAVIGIVALAVIDAEDPEPSVVLGIVGGSLIVGGAIPLGIAGINHANAPVVAHMVRVQPPQGDTYELLFDPNTGARVR